MAVSRLKSRRQWLKHRLFIQEVLNSHCSLSFAHFVQGVPGIQLPINEGVAPVTGLNLAIGQNELWCVVLAFLWRLQTFCRPRVPN